MIVSSIVFLLYSFSLPSIIHAQVSTAQLLGTVRDTSGATVAGATVTLKSASKGTTTSVTTDSEGSYVFPQVLVDTYSIEVSMQGFKRHEIPNIKLDVNQKARVDVELAVGQITELITVNSDANLANTVDGEVSTVVAQKNIVELPLKGRQFLELAFLTPGVVDGPASDYRRGIQGIAPAVNGNRPESNSYTLNGANNSESYEGFFVITPAVDSVEEFRIQSGTYNAEYGRAGGAIVNVVTKSGSNSFHGSVYEFFRNDVLNARNFFNSIRSPLRLNQYGVTIGGPVFLPRFGEGGRAVYDGKNRTFFFFNYEGYKERRASTRSSRFPTQAELSGNFSSSSVIVRNPATGLPFPGNRIPESMIDPVAKRYLSIFPQITSNAPGNSDINYINNTSLSNDNNTWGARIDHNFNVNNRIFGTLNWNDVDNVTPGPIPEGPGEVSNDFHNRMVNITYTSNISPRVINEARASYNRFNNPFDDQFPKRDYASELGLIGIPEDPNIRNRWPGIGFGQGYTGIPRSYEFTQITNTYQLQDNLSWVRGRHTMKFGAGFLHTQLIGNFITDAPSFWTFSGQFSGNAVADFLLGIASGNRTFLQGGKYYLGSDQYHFYGQDQWNVTNNLTLSFGLRYEIHTPWRETRGNASSVNRRTGALIVTRNAPDISSFATSLGLQVERLNTDTFYPTTYCCIGPLMPRVSFAYNMRNASLVLRGGYAVSLNTEIGNLINGGLAAPFWIRAVNNSNDYPAIGFNRNRPTISNLSSIGTEGINPDYKDGYVQSWNLTLEKELSNGMFFSAAYVGSKGTHLSALGYFNEAPPAPGPIAPRRPFPLLATSEYFDNFGDTHYHALQTKAEKRFSRGLSYLLSYTWSKALGNADTLNGFRIVTDLNKKTGRGRLAFDITHNFSAAVVYELPIGRGKYLLTNVSGLADKLVSGWQITTIYSAQTGYPIDLSVTPCLLNTGGGFCRPNVVGPNNGVLPRGERSIDRWFDTSAFVAPPPYTFGNNMPFAINGPGVNNFNTAFMKNTYFRERFNVQFRAEFYNLFNHTRFTSVGTTLGSSTFGKLIAATGEREIQFALKFIF